ncbi:MAG TPA: polyprenyl synthetase family protein [Bacteroidales bacterium]|mgnify:CR=1 FL=1|nr:polyprenyl synthetase family protein [Bacteroidales bacterium]
MIPIEQLQIKIEETIKNISYPSTPQGLYEPIAYVLEEGGKRLRPLLLLMSYNIFKEDVQIALYPAVGIEMFHNFTLLHDDIMDKADIRRNKATVHKKWNENTAILSGDAMMIKSFQFFYGLPLPIQSEVLKTFTQTALEVCEGQQYDMNFESRLDVSIDEYMEMIRLKTAVLLAAALKIGSQIAEAKNEDTELLYEAGIKMGLAFQLQDDYLDVYGDTKVFGKKIGGDIVANKKTYLLISALNLANENQRKSLLHLLNHAHDRDEKISKVTFLYNEMGVQNITKAKINELTKESLTLLEKVSEQKNISPIKELIIKLLDRNY